MTLILILMPIPKELPPWLKADWVSEAFEMIHHHSSQSSYAGGIAGSIFERKRPKGLATEWF